MICWAVANFECSQLDDMLVAKPLLIKLDEAETLSQQMFVHPLPSLIIFVRVGHCSTTYLNSASDGGGLVQKRMSEPGELCVGGE
jgi:hypothetical protein